MTSGETFHAGAGPEERPEVLVVGAGAVGVSVAYSLIRQGRSVVVVDSGSKVGAACSYGNAGLITPSHCIPLARPGALRGVRGWLRPGGAVYIKPRPSLGLLRFGAAFARASRRTRMIAGLRVLRDFSRASRDAFEELARAGDQFGYKRNGVMNVCWTRAGFQHLVEDAHLLEREGFSPEILDSEQARAREPRLREGITGAVYWEEDAHCNPSKYVESMAARATREGVRFELATRVLSITRQSDGSVGNVKTTRGVFRPRTLVMAAGAWTGGLARLIGQRLPLEPGKGYHAQVQDRSPLKMPLIFQEHVLAATPLGTDLRLAGTMDFVGYDTGPSEARARRLLADARNYLEGVEPEPSAVTWWGFRPCTPDSLPIIGRSNAASNVIYATGHGMLGLTLAPATGAAVASLVTGAGYGCDLTPFAPARYGA